MQFRDKNAGSASFLKLKAGDSVRGVFRGELNEYRQHWVEGIGGEPCPGAECEKCAQITPEMTDEEKKKFKPSFRCRVNFVVNENGAYTAKIWEFGYTVYEMLKGLHEGGYELPLNLMKVTRNGTGKTTSYSVLPVPNGLLTAEQLDAVGKVKLLDLVVKPKMASAPDLDAGEPVPF